MNKHSKGVIINNKECDMYSLIKSHFINYVCFQHYMQHRNYDCGAAVLRMVTEYTTGLPLPYDTAVHMTQCHNTGTAVVTLKKCCRQLGMTVRRVLLSDRVNAGSELLGAGWCVVIGVPMRRHGHWVLLAPYVDDDAILGNPLLPVPVVVDKLKWLEKADTAFAVSGK